MYEGGYGNETHLVFCTLLSFPVENVDESLVDAFDLLLP